MVGAGALVSRQIQIQPANAVRASRFAPLRGRKVLVFSDSRQVAARLAPNLLPKGEGCCGALLHHLGKEVGALVQARQNVNVWSAEIERRGLDAILIRRRAAAP